MPALENFPSLCNSESSEGFLPALALQVLREAADGVLITDQRLPGFPIIYVNSAFVAMTGYSTAEVLGRSCRFLQGADRAQPEVTLMREAIAAGKSITVVLRNYRSDGTPFHNEVRLAPLDRAADGTPIHYVGFQRNVTSRVEASLTLHHALQAAEEASRAKSSFLGVMSHEVRTPLNAVLGLSGSLLDSALSPEQNGLIRAIHSSGELLMRILNDVLDFSKLEAGEMRLETAPFSPAVLTKGVAALVETQAAGKGLQFRVECDPTLPAGLHGDAGRIRQVLLNLLSNAVKFTDAGAVVIRVESLSGDAKTAQVRWSVSDTGMGIPADRVKDLFREFVQIGDSIARRFGGTGLGLAISKRLVNRMGGTITVETEFGHGTAFRVDVTLPVADYRSDEDLEQTDAPHSLPAILAGRASRLRILMAEDNRTNQFVVQQLLKGLDIQLDMVGNGREAVEAVTNLSYDMIIMDMLMPEMDGLEATRAIRKQAGHLATIPIIGLSASPFAADIEACLDAGMNQFLSKPISKATLLAAIGEALEA